MNSQNTRRSDKSGDGIDPTLEDVVIWEGPEFQDPRPLGKMPRNLWKKMTKEQRFNWLEEKRKYRDSLQEEHRQKRARRRGY